ncbi:hypothetical protein NHP190003_02630 [Helicobacter sp. NHP19-003]|uniref:DUF4375 domain-containing protein n=1 Tax=Helicobacter gastrocanis TaxID=2849641 RepID=A0ABM7SB42_9HELI|nr:hypothetical protein [Helicobacter sp. NHP19-003]BCZ16981.1 hypothetical protein NHP190003_02630 [Helicobacter sp. NHP19-003]
MGQKELLQRFVEIEHADTEKKNRQTSRNLIFKPLKEGWDRWLENLNLNYTSYVSFYQRDWPAICFTRQDILGDEYVNGLSLKQRAGIYIWLGYGWKIHTFYLRIGCANSPYTPEECVAFRTLFKIFKNGEYDTKHDNEYRNFKQLQENFLYDFVELVKVLNAVPKEEFLKDGGDIK